jgi:ABC-type glycerol-3-phosphate transport system substrate-binding protein
MKLSLYRLLLVGLSFSAVILQARTLNILLLANASTQDVIQKLIREYQKQNPETDFNVSIVQSNSIVAKLNTLVTAGQPPDIVEITRAYVQNYAAQALDLSNYTNSQELLQRYLPSYRPFFTPGNKVLEYRWKPPRMDFSTIRDFSRRPESKSPETKMRFGRGTNLNRPSRR